MTSTLNNSAVSSDSSYTFKITLNNPCILTAPANPSTLDYAIGDGPESWQLASYISDTTNCKATETLTMSPSANWISIDSLTRTITVLTTDTSLSETSKTFTVTSTLNNSGVSSNSDYTFTIKLSNVVNVCKLTTPATPSTLTY